MVTGSSPDKYMDYDLKNQIPTLIDSFKDVNNNLKEVGGREFIKCVYTQD